MIDYFDVFRYTDQPTTCPKCGNRTEITFELPKSIENTQHHKCLSLKCQFEFVIQK